MALTCVKEITGRLCLEVVRGVNVQTGDTYSSKMKNIMGIFCHDENRAQTGATATFSGQTVTVTCTNNDEINLLIAGRK